MSNLRLLPDDHLFFLIPPFAGNRMKILYLEAQAATDCKETRA